MRNLPELNSVDVIILDQGETFMFDNDRFGPDQGYFETYRRIGGVRMNDEEVTRVVDFLIKSLIEAYEGREKDDDFPTVRDVIEASGHAVDKQDFDLLDDLFAEHEIGVIPEAHRDAIHRLSKTHRLGIISNIWAQPARFEHNLQKAGIFDCFEHIVWSSAHRKSKPSTKLFQAALDYWQLEPERILYVGDDPIRDVGGSKAVGMKSAWINPTLKGLPKGCPHPDIRIADLSDLLVRERRGG